MEIFGVDAWDEKKCVHASTLETVLMHGAERQELVHHFLEARAGRALAGAEPARGRGRPSAGGPEGNGRFGPEAPKGRILVNGLGGGTGRLPGVPGCDILELRIWYKTAALRRGSPCRTWVPNGFCFFRRGACDER